MEQKIRSQHIHGYFDGLSAYLNKNDTQPGEERLVLSPFLGTGVISRLKIRQGIEVIVSDMTLEEDWDQVIHEDRVFEINYCFSGRTDCLFKGNRFSTGIHSGNVYSVEDSEIRLFRRSKERYRGLEIRMTPEQVLRYFEGDEACVKGWLKDQAGRISPLMNSLPLQRAMHEMLCSPYHGSLKKLHMESKIMEIILLVLEKYTMGNDQFPDSWMKKQDIEKLYAARQIIAGRLENPLSLKELARAAELNEFKLKKGFKELFGMTVFAYVRDQRLEKGAYLMQAEQMNVGEAAAAVGYSNPSNFSAAFHKKYGCKPIQYVKSKKP
ncbi:helix-turn-helix transcriptional regulator [Paenibacillus donghaensis]|uniref:helix-turn-helix transcriptional regulator n=1 Tax=Paenibacillus donghaensis TaxID=414771 RepID=UPI0018845B9F|nr:AraC family transcriptional regulator [Paenibacillus donghaensis]MBE9916340.1 helix-turn-helix transcriptional regulator [Paenibacillus donghaensis]